MLLLGLEVTISPSVYEVKTVERSLKERLFTLPWHPFQRTKTVHEPAMYVVGNRIICHPSMEKRLREILKNQEAQTISDISRMGWKIP